MGHQRTPGRVFLLFRKCGFGGKKDRDGLNTKLRRISTIRGSADTVTVQRCLADYKTALQAISERQMGRDIGQKPMEERTVDRLDWSSLKWDLRHAK